MKISKKQYCYTCGKVLKVIPRIIGYDADTGYALMVDDLVCSTHKWYHLRLHPVTRSEASANYMCGMF